MSEKKTGCSCSTIVCALFLLGLLTVFVFTKCDAAVRDTERKEALRGPVYNSDWDGSVWQVDAYLKKHLKDPSSYESISWGQVVKNPNGGFLVRHKYRAKNSFGGYMIADDVFWLDKSGNVQFSHPYKEP